MLLITKKVAPGEIMKIQVIFGLIMKKRNASVKFQILAKMICILFVFKIVYLWKAYACTCIVALQSRSQS